MHRHLKYLPTVLAGLIATTSSIVLAETTLGSKEVTTLFSDKTVSYHSDKHGHDATVYYSPDGTMKGVRDGEPMSGKWKVNGRGELCLKEGMKNLCRSIVESNGEYKKIRIKHNGNEVLHTTYKAFIDGNPNNY